MKEEEVRPYTLGETLFYLATGFTILFLCMTFTNQDPEGRLLAAAISGIGVCFLAPIYAVRFGSGRIILAAMLAAITAIGALYLNAWACKISGTRYTSPLDHAFLLVFSAIGLAITPFLIKCDRRRD